MDAAQNKNRRKKSPFHNLTFEELENSRLTMLSTLENFDSAFLSWLGNNYKKEFLKSFEEILKQSNKWKNFQYIFNDTVSDDDIECIAQSHEGENIIIDTKITVFKGGGKSKEANIFIKNNIKSYPSQDQINKYYKELVENKEENNIIIILCLYYHPKMGNCLTLYHDELNKRLDEIFKDLRYEDEEWVYDH